MNGSHVVAEIDRAIQRHHLLQHPFYEKWQAGTLSRAKLRLYAQQYYWHVENFPIHLADLARRTRGRLREVMLENLSKEENPSAPHPKLWRDFAAALNVNEESLWLSVPLPGIEALVARYRTVCRESPVPEAVAALYAYEAQVPEISMRKMEGLRKHYGITGKKGLAYFEIHEETDRLHRAAWRNWLEEASDDVEPGRILATVETALQALWGALDAVEQSAN
jgi:pyrroloquinoline-quinone synthase